MSVMNTKSILVRTSDQKEFAVVDLGHWSTIRASDAEEDRVKWYGDGYVSASKGFTYRVKAA